MKHTTNIKTYVLDTNVLLHDPEAMYKFEEHTVVLSVETLRELDSKKTVEGPLGVAARKINRELRALFGEKMQMSAPGRANASLVRKNGCKRGKISIVINPFLTSTGPAEYEFAKRILEDGIHPDHQIILSAKAVALTTKPPVIFVTKDSNAALKAMMVGLTVQDYLNDRVESTQVQGHTEIAVTKQGFDEILATGMLNIINAEMNEYFIITDGVRKKAVRYLGDGTVHLVSHSKINVRGKEVEAKNLEQDMLVDALLDPNIQLVTCCGVAGTGKTFLGLAAALSQVVGMQLYDKILITRTIVQIGKDMGALPGGKDEKMAPFLQPYFDNLEVLLGVDKVNTPTVSNIPQARPDNISKKAWKRLQDLMGSNQEEAKKYYSRLLFTHKPVVPQPLMGGMPKEDVKPKKCYQWLLDKGILEIEAMAYVRGRSLPNSILLVDECQNMLPREVKTIVTRAGTGTKVVLFGDPDQIDTPFLTADSNGLTYVMKKMKGSKLATNITLKKTVRSALAEEGATRL